MGTEYNGKDLKNTLETVDHLLHKAKMELHEVVKENESILKMFDEKQTKASDKIVTGVSHLIGRTPKRITPYRNWWSNSDFLFIECEDGQRIMILGNPSETIRHPDITPEQMKKTGFYNDEEIERAIDYIKAEKKRSEESRIQEKKRELERLSKELDGK